MKYGWLAMMLALLGMGSITSIATGQALPPLEGFGASTPGGSGGTVVHVTSLEAYGSGTLHDALKQGNQIYIVFQVSGTIHMPYALQVRDQSFVTIDGASAPEPGITLTGEGLDIRGSHDIIVRHIRVRDAATDGIRVRQGSSHVVIDHCSVNNSGDENIAITYDTTDVTVSWCLIGDTRPDSFDLRTRGILISEASADLPPVNRISLHHNLIINEYQRSPKVSTSGLVDIRNNVIMNWRVHGIQFENGAHGNIVNNVFGTDFKPHRAVFMMNSAGPAYIHGNLGPGNTDVDALQTALVPFQVGAITTDPVEDVLHAVLSGAGVFPRDAVDALLVGMAN